ncbi:CHC2 zinc finger domain-containing protein [Pseudoflavonifractor sp. 524-17]|uniref:CHC2 zinc finger domain-containing protein n=1 Tax=Pseudoflavonifractor sp. 524-17 TaxID=2304577 RepID=UPI00137B5483|nr:CHC2 zinc finger domain-containing protein [Pseudoflavonifractor sp. 524-17]
MTDVFRAVRERVSAKDAARHYGLTFDRKGWALCPFHPDKHPSMSFRAGRFRCWACNASGDSIDFTGRLLGLEPMAAVERLNADFALALPFHRQPTTAEVQAAKRRMEVAKVHKAFEEWQEAFIPKLCVAYRVAHIALQGIDTPDDFDRLTEREALATLL